MKRGVHTASVDDTEALGRRLGGLLRAGDVITLRGDLGAGKTALVRGICAGLGCAQRASSPSYALVHVYDGPVPVFHYDLYRVSGEDDMVMMEVEESLDGGAVVLIEWPDAVAPLLPGCSDEARTTSSAQPDEDGPPTTSAPRWASWTRPTGRAARRGRIRTRRWPGR